MVKNSKRNGIDRSNKRKRYAVAAFVTALALIVTLVAPSSAGGGGARSGRTDSPQTVAAISPSAVSTAPDVSTDAPVVSGEPNASEEYGAGSPAEPAKKSEKSANPKWRAAEERAIERKAIEPAPDEEYEGYIVIMADDADEPVAKAAGKAGYSASASGGYVRVDEPLDALDFADAAYIDRIVPNYRVHLSDFPDGDPNDPKWNVQWNLRSPEYVGAVGVTTGYGIGASALYSRGLSGEGISVGVFDTGLGRNSDFRDYDGFLAQGLNFDTMAWGEGPETASHDGLPKNFSSWYHGTMVAGFLAAVVNNEDKIAGLVDGADIYPYRVFNQESADLFTIYYGLDYLLENDQLPDVVNMSLGTEENEIVGEELRMIFDRVAAEGSIVVAAAGNQGVNQGTPGGDYLEYPAAYDSVISVGSGSRSGSMAANSQENAKVDVAAPGVSVTSLYPDSDPDGSPNSVGVGTGGGTSYAAPLVAGVAAAAKQLAAQKNLELDVYAFRDLIKHTSRKIHFGSSDAYDANGHSDSYGYGLLDAEALLSYLGQEGLRCISYDLKGGYFDNSYVPVSFVTAGALTFGVPLPTDPTFIKKDGYTFVGWYAKDDYASLVTTATAAMLSGSTIDLTARWTPDATSPLSQFKASDFMISESFIREIEDAGYDNPYITSDDVAAAAGYARGIVSLSALADVKLAAEDSVADAYPYTSFYISSLDDPVGVYPVVISTERGGYATVAMSVYDDGNIGASQALPTRYEVTNGDIVEEQGAFVTAEDKDIKVSLSAVSTVSIAALSKARAFTWRRVDTEILGLSECDVISGGLESVTKAGIYTVWVAPEGHETEARITLSAIVADGSDTYYSIVLKAPEALGGNPQPISIQANREIPALPVPVRPGYEFLGWYIEGMSTRIDAGTPYDYGRNVTAVAKWAPKSFTIRASLPPRYVNSGGSAALTANFSGDTLTSADKAVRWTVESYGGTAAKVDETTGVFTAGNREGAATVRVASAYFPSIYDELTVTVARPVTKVAMPFKTLYMKKGTSFSASASAYSQDGDGAKLEWSSSNTRVATVSATGKVKALAKGTATITARSLNGKFAKFTVKVVSKAKKIKKIKVSGYTKTMKRGKSAQLKVSVSPASATVTKISFKSSKPSILRVDKTGRLTAKKKGLATITVKVGDKSQKIKIRVK